MDATSQFLARKALQFIIDAFKDPHCPVYCEVILLGCFTTLKDYACTPLHYPYFDAIMGFISAPRSATEFDYLKHTMTCRCKHDPKLDKRSVRAMHARAAKQGVVPDADPPAFEILMSTLFGVIETAVECAFKQGGSLYKMNKRNKRVKESEGVVPWPLQPAALIPHGPEDSIRGLIRWAKTEQYIYGSVVNIIRQLVQGCNRVVIPYVINSPTLFHALINHLEDGYVGWNDPTNDSQYQNHTSAVKRLKQGALLAHSIMDRTDSIERSVLVKTLNHEETALRFCNGAIFWANSLTSVMGPLEEQDQTDIDFIHDAFVRLGGAFYATCRPDNARKVKPNYEIILAAHTQKYAMEEPLQASFLAIKELASAERCAAPGCRRTYADIGRKFRHCSGCWRAPYCSVVCQADAWRDPVAPHRDVCRMIEELSLAGELGPKIHDGDADDYYDLVKEEPYLAKYAEKVKLHWRTLTAERAKCWGRFAVKLHRTHY